MSDALKRLQGWKAEIAIILGSGLSAIVQHPLESIDYAELSEIPQARVPGHAGKFSLCQISGVRVIFARGRVHLYEGHSAEAVTANVRMLAYAGITKLIVTNAAGAVNEKFEPGDWMMIVDHLNLTGASPLIGVANFLDMSEAYSPAMCALFASAARRIRIQLREGVYAAVIGPQYETPAEVRMLQKLGADAIGMSTVLEVIQARALGMEVAGFSGITNLAAGISTEKLSHTEVLATGAKAAKDFARLLADVLPKL